MSLELLAAVDLNSTLLETAPITDSTVAAPQAAKISEPQPIKRGTPLTATEKYVADYLGITSETLSRIRSKENKKIKKV